MDARFLPGSRVIAGNHGMDRSRCLTRAPLPDARPDGDAAPPDGLAVLDFPDRQTSHQSMVATHDIKLALAASDLKQPLHIKVRQILREQILHDFQHGQRFYTERDLMQKLAVSQATVRRAVQDLVTEGYLQSDPRRGLFVQRHQEVRYVGLVMPARGGYSQQVAAEYIELCRRHNCIPNIHSFHRDETADDIMRLIQRRPSEERVILAGLTVELTIELCSRLQAAGYQHVVSGAKLGGATGGSVSLDHEGEVDQVLDYLTGLGHERICFIVNEPRNLLITSLRAKAVERRLRERNLHHARIVYCDTVNWESSFAAAYEKTREIMEQQPVPTAIVPLSGVGAWAVLRYAIERRIAVPQELSIVCFDPMVNNSILAIPMTQLEFSQEELAERTIKLLWSETSAMHELITPRLVVHASTAAPSAGAPGA